MKKTTRMEWAKDTVSICEAGFYLAPSGKRVDIAATAKKAAEGTVMYSPDDTMPPNENRSTSPTAFEVVNETTFNALARPDGLGGHAGCLNFASAKNPGGGFLTGAQAQEEALARSSALYPCLLKVPQYYERNRANRSTIYLDLVIYSPLVPFFRNDDGVLLERPILASVITAPAPNAGAVTQNEPQNAAAIEQALRRRAELVLRVASAHKIEQLVLGAWGCGVFRNDPRMVAAIFADLLKPAGKFAGAFPHVVCAVFDRSEGETTYRAFAEVFNGGTA
jgi:uncharacterized protein (TIGR02452 family)